MKHYELLYIIPAKFAGAEMEKIQSRVKDAITKEGGKIDYEENVGKKKLAYPIKHNHQGFYTLYEFDVEPSKLKSIDTKITFISEVIRHLIVAKTPITAEERAVQKKQEQKNDSNKEESTMTDQFNIEKQLEEKTEKKIEVKAKEVKTETVEKPVKVKKLKKEEKAEEVKKEETKEENKEETKEEVKAVDTKEEDAKKEKQDKVKLDDLDKKLDEIIDSNIF